MVRFNILDTALGKVYWWVLTVESAAVWECMEYLKLKWFTKIKKKISSKEVFEENL